jgi:bleomycin hydrolase
MKLYSKIFIFTCLFLTISLALAKEQKANIKQENVHIFSTDIILKSTPVKDQYKSNTCWAFATISFLESELLRLNKGEFDLSEMFVVRNVYPQKAIFYYRNHGKANFGEGGQAHDVIKTIKQFGIVPEQIYPGLQTGESRHNHSEMYAILKAILDAVLNNDKEKVSPLWYKTFEEALNIYLGKIPTEFEYNGKQYTPKNFLNNLLQLNLDDYVEVTSYGFYPFYEKVALQIPDNWDHDSNYLNVPIDDLESIIDFSLKNGYSLVWDGDVTEKEFSTEELGYAVVPAKNWEEKSLAEKQKPILEPEEEKEITQEMRDFSFNDFTTTDDHLMHIIGIAHDQKGTKFYIAKNSSGTDKKFNGYVYLSRSYVRLKTVAILVNKNAIPDIIKKNLKLY